MITAEAFVVGESAIEGRGVFASRDIEKGETLCFFEGEPRSFAECEALYKQGNTRISCDHFQVGVRSYIELKEPFVFINHSCEPNTGFRGERELVALRGIKAGEEIFYDYSATEWTVQDYPPYYMDGWPMTCRCGSAQCRKRIGCFPYIPEATKKQYLDSGIIQDYILERMKEPKETSRCLICEKYL